MVLLGSLKNSAKNGVYQYNRKKREKQRVLTDFRHSEIGPGQ